MGECNITQLERMSFQLEFYIVFELSHPHSSIMNIVDCMLHSKIDYVMLFASSLLEVITVCNSSSHCWNDETLPICTKVDNNHNDTESIIDKKKIRLLVPKKFKLPFKMVSILSICKPCDPYIISTTPRLITEVLGK